VKVTAPASKEQAAAYEALEKRSEQRQQELDKLNQRLKSLEENTKAMQDSIKANSQPIEEAQGRRLKRVE
jgi:flagellar motility protein MotE (MotC chaperone)